MTDTTTHKLIITGTGRAGTTFLVQLLTELGLDTGYRSGHWGADYHAHCQAGLEHDLRDPRSPYVVKNPALCETLGETLARGNLVIDHALVPVRELNAAAASRIRIGGSGRTPGGLLGDAEEAKQAPLLAERFHRLVHTLATHEVPVTFLHFPRLVQDADYAYRALRSALPAVSWAQFETAFRRIARPELVHDFRGGRSADAGLPARAHRAAAALARARRHRLRWVTAVALGTIAAGVWFAARAPA